MEVPTAGRRLFDFSHRKRQGLVAMQSSRPPWAAGSCVCDCFVQVVYNGKLGNMMAICHRNMMVIYNIMEYNGDISWGDL